MERGGVSFAQEHFINNSCADNNVRQCMSILISRVLLTDIRRDRFPFNESGIPLFFNCADLLFTHQLTRPRSPLFNTLRYASIGHRVAYCRTHAHSTPRVQPVVKIRGTFTGIRGEWRVGCMSRNPHRIKGFAYFPGVAKLPVWVSRRQQQNPIIKMVQTDIQKFLRVEPLRH